MKITVHDVGRDVQLKNGKSATITYLNGDCKKYPFCIEVECDDHSIIHPVTASGKARPTNVQHPFDIHHFID